MRQFISASRLEESPNRLHCAPDLKSSKNFSYLDLDLSKASHFRILVVDERRKEEFNEIIRVDDQRTGEGLRVVAEHAPLL